MKNYMKFIVNNKKAAISEGGVIALLILAVAATCVTGIIAACTYNIHELDVKAKASQIQKK